MTDLDDRRSRTLGHETLRGHGWAVGNGGTSWESEAPALWIPYSAGASRAWASLMRTPVGHADPEVRSQSKRIPVCTDRTVIAFITGAAPIE